MTTSFSNNSDVTRPQVTDRTAPQRDSAAQNVLHQISTEDRQNVREREEATRANSRANDTLPTLSFVFGDHRDIQRVVAGNQGLFDRNSDGRISTDELDHAAVDPRTQRVPGAGAVVAALRNDFEAVAGSAPGAHDSRNITMADLNTLSNRAAGDKNTREIDRYMREEPTRGNDNPLFGAQDRVAPDAVRQGAITDCVLMSGLLSLSSRPEGQRLLRDMIQQNGQGYRVHFGNGQTVDTARPSSTEMSIYADGNNDRNGIWPSVAERAFGQVMATQRHMDPSTPQLADQLLSAPEMVAGLLGRRVNDTHIDQLTDEQLHQQLSQVSPHALLMVAGTGPYPTSRVDIVDASGRPTGQTDELTDKHSYAVDRYDAASRNVYLRNPINGGQLLRLSLHDFRSNFLTLTSVDGQQR